jgi:hypothetical protein
MVNMAKMNQIHHPNLVKALGRAKFGPVGQPGRDDGHNLGAGGSQRFLKAQMQIVGPASRMAPMGIFTQDE